jgi:hypothetical protein
LRRLGSATALLLLLLVAGRPPQVGAQATGQPAASAYYVDCQAGNDGRSGLSAAQAWLSLARANAAPLAPGDRLLFRRGCAWQGTLHAGWAGTPAAPITIGAYGAGSLPRFVNGPADLADRYHNAVSITGSYLVLEYLEAALENPPVDPGCLNNPVGFYIGFNFRNPANTANGGSHNTLRHGRATGFTAGVHTNTNTHHNRFLDNTLRENRAMHILTPTSTHSSDDIGAWGILLKGDYHEVAFNTFGGNNAYCTYDTPPQGNSVELFEARYSAIHHNIAVNDRDFSEVGGSAALKADGNTFAFNLVVSNIADAHFVVLRGSGSSWGPTWRTRLYNNTVYFTGPASEALICGAGCSADILTARNNIFWAELKAAYADRPFAESNNLYWNSQAEPFVQFLGFEIHPTSHVADPRFASPYGLNFRLLAASPAVNHGSEDSLLAGFTHDLLDTLLPQQGTIDIGAYEYYPINYNRAFFLPLLHLND